MTGSKTRKGTEGRTPIERLVLEHAHGTVPQEGTLDTEEKILAFAQRMEEATKETRALDRKAREESLISVLSARVD